MAVLPVVPIDASAPAPPGSSLGAPLPPPRGPLTSRLFEALRLPVHDLRWSAGADVLAATEDDRQLALYCCYELHYGGFPDVVPGWEWEPSLLALRRGLEQHLEDQLCGWVAAASVEGGRSPSGRVQRSELTTDDVVEGLWAMTRGGGGPSLSAWLAEHGTIEHVRELAAHRSAYQLKEADPHTWGIPHLGGEAKAVMVAIQAGEYGDGEAAAMHSSLFAVTMEALGLDATPNALLGRVPGATLLTTNMISLFGLHRRWRGALVGHLALFEMTSTVPMRRYAATLQRLGLGAGARRFYEVHVQADAVHEHMAAGTMVPGLLRREPELARDVLFGARALQVTEARAAGAIVAAWEAERSSLLPRVAAVRSRWS